MFSITVSNRQRQIERQMANKQSAVFLCLYSERNSWSLDKQTMNSPIWSQSKFMLQVKYKNQGTIWLALWLLQPLPAITQNQPAPLCVC